MSDFHAIRNSGHRLLIDEYNELNSKSITFLSNEVIGINEEERLIVATHHVPTFKNYPPQFHGDPLNEAFAVELYDLIFENHIDAWIYGHTHFNPGIFEINGTKMLSNQLGYVEYGEQKGFVHDMLI